MVCGFRHLAVDGAWRAGRAWPARPGRARSPVKAGMAGRKTGGTVRQSPGGRMRRGTVGGCRPPGVPRGGTAGQGLCSAARPFGTADLAPGSLPLSSLLWPAPRRAPPRARQSGGTLSPCRCRHPAVTPCPGFFLDGRGLHGGPRPSRARRPRPARPPGATLPRQRNAARHDEEAAPGHPPRCRSLSIKHSEMVCWIY
jgi:hypothetical protein